MAQAKQTQAATTQAATTQAATTQAAFDMGALANAIATAATLGGGNVPLHKYARAEGLPASAATTQFTLHARFPADARNGGSAKTVMHAVALAAHDATAGGTRPATGAAIADAFCAMFADGRIPTRNIGKYGPDGRMPCGAWVWGYVQGAARKGHEILARA